MSNKVETEIQFNKLWEENEPYIRKLCTYKLSSMPQYIDDCVQETFKALFETLSSGTNIERPKAWLSRVANNKIKDIYEKNKKETTRLIPLIEENVAAYKVDFLQEENSQFSEEDILSAKSFVMNSISESERKLLNERFEQKKSVAELAKIYGTTEVNIRQRIFRLKKKAKSLVKEYLK